MKEGEVIMAVSGNPGLPTILKIDACIHDGFVCFRSLSSKLLPEFLYYLLIHFKAHSSSQSVGAVFRNLTTDQIKAFKIPIPPIDTQRQIISGIDEEQRAISSNRLLIQIFEQKISNKLAEVWEK